jgi:hypothetical protein
VFILPLHAPYWHFLPRDQAYEKRTDDASLRVTISDLLLQTIDDNSQPLGAWECPASGACDPVRTSSDSTSGVRRLGRR